DVAIGIALEVTGRVMVIALQPGQVAQRVIPIARALGAEEKPRFPVRRRRPQQLRLARRGVAVIEVVAGEVVGGEAVPLSVVDRRPERNGAAEGTRSVRA